MELHPQDTLNKLEFDQVIGRIAAYMMGSPAKENLFKSKLLTDYKTIDLELQRVSQLKEIMLAGETFPIRNYESIKKDLSYLAKENYVLEIESIQAIHAHIAMFLDITQFLKSLKGFTKDSLLSIIADTEDLPILPKLISKVIDDEGEIKKDASEALKLIHKQISTKEREVNVVFNKVIGELRKKGLLSDTEETYRNSRRVLSIPAEFKRQIKGVTHDESASGKTVFIEPNDVIFINEELANLEVERRKEIYKILRDLCNQLREHVETIREYAIHNQLFDRIHAKSKFAIEIKAIKPILVDTAVIRLHGAYHPLLLLKNRNLGKPTIPCDITLDRNKILVISGPNAGGKSIALKTVGLLQLMVQFGCLVPVSQESQFGIFRKIMTDIGDQQSIEDDLSTYSSHLKNMKYMITHSDGDTLILIDEFGSGTDPKIGGALAEGVLLELVKKNVYGVITTHYSNLKIIAHNQKGLVNGAMEFDKEGLRPTFHLKIGKPGSSFAFEVAEKIELPSVVIGYAKKITAKSIGNIDDLLANLETEQKKAKKSYELLEEERKGLDKLVKTYNQLFQELEYRRKKYKIERKENELKSLNTQKVQIDRLIKDLQDENNVKIVKSVHSKTEAKKEEVVADLFQLKKEVYYDSKFALDQFEVGQFVELRTGGMTGEITRIQNNKADVNLGNMIMKVSLNDLRPTAKPITIRKEKSVRTFLTNENEKAEDDLDIRGYRHSEAKAFIQEFLDKALMSNHRRLKIIHGKGSGTLRKLVVKSVKEYKDVNKVWHPEEEFGGESVTFVEF